MTEKRFEVTNISTNGMTGLFKLGNDTLSVYDVARLVNELLEENEQLKQQIKIFEKFLEVNELSIDWDEFCGVDECAFENPDFSCKECIHLKGDVE